MPRRASLVLGLLLLGCSSEDPDPLPIDPGGTGGSGGDGGGGGGPTAAACDAHAAPAPASFTDRTEAWGLGDVDAIILSAADLDGDGYPDLVAHRVAPHQREVIGEEPRLYRVLFNVPGADGGRTFVDRTVESGYGATADGSRTELRSAQMAVFGDVDNDGDLDVWSGTHGMPNLEQDPPTPADLDRSTVLLNDGAGRFTRAPGSEVAAEDSESTAGGSFTDADRDGTLDLFVGAWFANTVNYPSSYQRLLLGDRAVPGVFHDVSDPAGIRELSNKRPAFGTTACDVDDDGAPELLVSAYGRTPNVLYQREPGGGLVFRDVGVESGFAYDDDLSYQDDQFYRCYCTLHADAAVCEGAEEPQVVCPSPADAYWAPGYSDDPENLGGNTFTTVCADLTGDGKLDLYNTEIVHWWAGSGSDPSELLVNASDASGIRFDRPGNEATGMVWPHVGPSWNEGGLYASPGDLDLDGREDLLVGASDYDDQFALVFRARGDGTFEEVAEASGLVHACASAPLVVDFDRDGDLDVVVGSSLMRDWCADQHETEEVHFYENDAAAGGASYLAVKLVGDGVTANRAGIGAKVTVRTEDESGESTAQVRELGGGYGHFGLQNDTVLFFGLGGCDVVHEVTVRWPDGAATTQTWTNVEAGRLVELRQGDPGVF